MALWRELRGMGFPGSSKQVHRWLAERRTAPSKFGRRAAAIDARPCAREKGPPLPAPRQLAWTLVQPAAALGATDTAVVSRVEQDAEARIAAALARQFTALVCACGVAGRRKGGAPAEPGAELEAWLANARTCGIGAIETFAAGLETDSAAVCAALIETWSSGRAEGQVNRLKLPKRQSYGCASFDLLRRRVLLAA